MKTIGLIGGMTWESSAEYYRIINEAVRERLGGLYSARSLMFTVEFAEVEQLQREARWEEAGEVMADAARRLERGGASSCCAPTPCTWPPTPSPRLSTCPSSTSPTPRASGSERPGLTTVGLLGTRYTMEQDFYRNRLTESFGLDVFIPDEPGRTTVHDVIYNELSLGRFEEPSRAAYRAVMAALVERGAEGIILGCTEIGLLVSDGDASVPLFDTTRIHAEAAVDLALR